MGSLSDNMLSVGVVSLVETLHGEPVEILTGEDAGKTFNAVIEVMPDDTFQSIIAGDPRGKRVARFKQNNAPRLRPQDFIKTSDGHKWRAVRKPDNAYLTTDFELIEFTGKDK